MIDYLRYFLGTTAFVLAVAGGINFIVDPANIYREGRVTPESYAEALMRSEHGLYYIDGMVDERLLVKAIASNSLTDDCIVIGSSHVMQIGNNNESKALHDICGSILNLGVSGGGIEDHFTIAYLALKQHKVGRPNKIILGLSPWVFAFGKDQRWSIYRDDYLLSKAEILSADKGITSIPSAEIEEAIKKKMSNLINLEYTIRSLKTIIRDFKSGKPTIAAAPVLDITVGGEYPIRLRDNSLVYSAKYISDAIDAHIPFGGISYATEGVLNQPSAINAYRDLILWIKSKGIEPVLLMTPYHENVFKSSKSPNAVALGATEPIVLKLALDLDVKIIGSYDPHMFGCLSNEFYDFMHPTAKCVDKLQFR
jgi:hypothetical protein